MGQFHFDPATYPADIVADIPAYAELQRRLAAATAGVAVTRALDLGAGTGETTRALRRAHPTALVVAVDESPGMLAQVDDDVETRVARLQDPLPPGPFELVVSALAVHHLEPDEKRDLFERVHDALCPGGRFVLADVVRGAVVVAPLTPGYDKPDTAADQLAWLGDAGFLAELLWAHDDLALLRADRP